MIITLNIRYDCRTNHETHLIWTLHIPAEYASSSARTTLKEIPSLESKVRSASGALTVQISYIYVTFDELEVARTTTIYHRLNFPGVVYPRVGHSFVLSEISKQPESQSLIESRKSTYRAREYWVYSIARMVTVFFIVRKIYFVSQGAITKGHQNFIWL